ncbi:AAA family ATPase [Bacillus sp. FJAT-49732]|uniref:AAA family ATPase n=1 Tax=Lederbergia citrisecunda TaxID=2833583 RepID=A0A942YKE5_9BACI|nr:AAA family ATPase [Lederbergia citrisecunda]MBS4198515.1 AAA family ATPase [Lederbergia citrisecunda]
MKIKSLHIFGYGKFIDFYIDDFSNMQIIYGENEAGKSTIMSFIHSILFGFPSRQQSNLRYEPKNHSAYGGRLTLETIEHGDVIIERLKGKSAGNVTIFLKNGITGGEELLSELLSGMNRSLYESIFSFNLQGIQEVHKLKGDEINRYLVASGTMGTDILLNIEQSFQKELDQLFKPNGRKPKLNEMISLLRENEKDLQKAKQKNDEYGSLLIKREATEEQLILLQNDLQILNDELQKVNELVEKWEKVKEYDRIQRHIVEIGIVHFPTDGLKRYENTSEKRIEISSRLKTLQEKIENIDYRIEQNTPLTSFQSIMERAEKVIMEWPIYEQLQTEIISLKREILSYTDQVERICRDINFKNESHSTIFNLNLGLDMKGNIKETLHDQVTLMTKLDSVQIQIDSTHSEIEKVEAACELIEQNMLSEKDFKKLEKEKENWKNPNQLVEEKNNLEKTIKKNKSDAKGTKKAFLFNALFLLGAIGFIIWAILASEWMIAVFAGLVLVYVLTNLKTFLNRLHFTKSDNVKLQARLQTISEIMMANSRDNNPIQLYDEQLNYRNQLQNYDHQLDQKLKHMDQLQRQKIETSNLIQRNQIQINNIKEELGLSVHFNDTRLDEAFDLIVELVKIIKASQKIEEELNLKVQKQEQWMEDLHEISHSAGLEFSETGEAIFRLKQLLQVEREKKLVQKDLFIKLNELKEESGQLQLELQEYNSLKDQLFKITDTNNEEEFRQQASQFNKLEKLNERFEILQAQLGNSLLKHAEAYQSDMDLKRRKNELMNLIDDKSSLLNKLRNEYASLRHEIQVLEEGGTYTEKLHQFYLLKSSFNEEAKIWAKYTVAKTILQKTMDKYIGERFPIVVSKAQEYMAFLTDDEYSRLYFLDDEGIVIDRADGQRFTPAELSQGTSEQLYTSLRLALVQVLYEDYPFPIIIDDGFVNFDTRRTGKVLGLIETISKTTQVVLFTCHEHIRNRFSESNVKTLPQERDVLQTLK